MKHYQCAICDVWLVADAILLCIAVLNIAARWSFVITPLNYNLAGANIFVAATNVYQLYRVFRGRQVTGTGGLADAIEK